MSDKNIENNRVLVADSDKSTRDFCRQVLEGGHYEVKEAEDLGSALDIAGNFMPSVILSGMAIAKSLREAYESDITAPTLVAYARDLKQIDKIWRLQGLVLGMPLDPVDLLQVVEGAVYGPIPVCSYCELEYRAGDRSYIFYRSSRSLGRYDVWFGDAKPAGLNFSHSVCPEHFDDAEADMLG